MKKILNIIIWKFRNKGFLKNKLSHSLFHSTIGILYGFNTQRNLKIMSIISILVLILTAVVKLPIFQVLIIIYSISCVLITELINTSIELLVDLVTKEYRLKAMLAKDVAAGATLLAVIQSIIIGTVITLRFLSII